MDNIIIDWAGTAGDVIHSLSFYLLQPVVSANVAVTVNDDPTWNAIVDSEKKIQRGIMLLHSVFNSTPTVPLP